MANGGTSFDGTRILSRSAVDLMRTNRLTAQQLPDFNWPQLRGYGYGLGVRTLIDRAYGGSLSPHGEFGWGGAAGSYIMIDPENRISASNTTRVLLCQIFTKKYIIRIFCELQKQRNWIII